MEVAALLMFEGVSYTSEEARESTREFPSSSMYLTISLCLLFSSLKDAGGRILHGNLSLELCNCRTLSGPPTLSQKWCNSITAVPTHNDDM